MSDMENGLLYFLDDKINCTGCTACFSVCPKHCIKMNKDDEGFLYPEADDTCVHCGLCEKVCPIRNFEKHKKAINDQIAYAAVSNDFGVWQRSSSGGAFSEICKAFGDDETIFCGAIWDGLKVRHHCVKGIDNISMFCKSKYIASEVGGSFNSIKNSLKDGKKVVFSGTPCQVSGLKCFLNKDYSNLLTIDLICHGVGSPDVFDECIKNMEKQYNCRIMHYEFRAKKRKSENKVLKHGNDVSRCIYLINDPYIQLFLSQNCLRPSCGANCRYRNINRQGDITIADFKGLGQVFPQLSGSKKNYSTIVFNTEKGKMIIPQLSTNMRMYSCNLGDIEKYNPLFCKQTWFSETRDAFFDEFICNKEKAVCKYSRHSEEYSPSFPRKVWSSLPERIRKVIYKTIKHGGTTNDYESCVVSKINVKDND